MQRDVQKAYPLPSTCVRFHWQGGRGRSRGLCAFGGLQRLPISSCLTVPALTAYPDDFRRKELLEAGCVAYLFKPVDMAQLMREIEQASERAV